MDTNDTRNTDVDNLAKKLNTFISIFFKNIKKDSWRVERKKDNEIINYLKNSKNTIVSTVNKINYIDKDNYTNITIYNKDIENQKKLLKQFKNILKIDNKNIDNLLIDLFFKSKQNMLFKYTINNKKTNKFGTDIKYEYMLENYIYNNTYKNNLIKIFKIIENNFINNEYVILDKTYNLTKFTQIFINDQLFEDIKNNVISEQKKQETIELILDIKNRLIEKVIIYILHINMMIKHQIIKHKDLIILLKYMKKEIKHGLNQPNNIIYFENTAMWCYYFIINYILYKNIEEYTTIFTNNILIKIYNKYKYLQYI